MATFSIPTTAPIERVPPELLIQVFKLTLPHIWFQEEINYYSSLKRLALVCRRWRRIVLSTPDLWRLLGAGDAPAPSTIISRAGRLPILYAVLRTSEMKAWGPEVFRTIGQWEKAEISISPEDSNDFNALATPAYNLQFLALEGTPRTEEEATSTPQPFVEGLFDQDAPKLRVLHLTSVTIPWKSPLMSNLVSLKLVNIFTNPPSIADMQQLLQHCSRLEILCLEDVAVPDEVDPSAIGQLTVPSLQHWRLRMNRPIALARLLYFIEARECMVLEVGGCPSLYDDLITIAAAPVALNILSRAFYYPYPLKLKLECTREVLRLLIEFDGVEAGKPLLSLDVNSQVAFGFLPSTIFPNRESTATVSLYLKEIAVPLNCFQKFPGVASLILENIANFAELIQYLASPEETVCPAPKLRRITIFGIWKDTEPGFDLSTVEKLARDRHLHVTIQEEDKSWRCIVPDVSNTS